MVLKRIVKSLGPWDIHTPLHIPFIPLQIPSISLSYLTILVIESQSEPYNVLTSKQIENVSQVLNKHTLFFTCVQV